MASTHHSCTLPIRDLSDVGEARRAVEALAASAAFDETRMGQLRIIVTELATNLAKHANGGELVVRRMAGMEGDGIEILSIDRGPGIANIARAMEDGYSTAGSPGNGLGAMKRLSQRFDVYSQEGAGTVFSIFFGKAPQSPLLTGLVCVPFPGEKECGDGAAVFPLESGFRLLMVDGLGHGEAAATAAGIALEVTGNLPKQSSVQVLESLHVALRATRGAAIAVATVDTTKQILTFAGVGNIAGSLLADGKARGLASYNGIVGHQAYKVREIDYPFICPCLLVLTTDGITTRWKLDGYPGIQHSHPSIIAALLYRDYRRERDDATVMVVKG